MPAISTQIRFLSVVIAMAASAFASAPAMANSASSADIAAPLRTAEATRTSTTTSAGDEQFQRLFATWQALDGNTHLPSAAPQKGAVSIPSIVPLAGVHMTSGFGMRWHPVIGGRRQHQGVDLASPIGTPIHATADGMVAMAERFGGYGLYVQIEHGGSLETRYGHMSRIAVAQGQQVHKGDVIGYVGTTGRSTGPHLHYEVRVDGSAVNPMPYMHGGEQLDGGDDATVLASR
jgi:murein DD-endopeptidase MepM/ murein hydrolase activator NlpD